MAPDHVLFCRHVVLGAPWKPRKHVPLHTEPMGRLWQVPPGHVPFGSFTAAKLALLQTAVVVGVPAGPGLQGVRGLHVGMRSSAGMAMQSRPQLHRLKSDRIQRDLSQVLGRLVRWVPHLF